MPANRRAQSSDVCVWIWPLTIGYVYRGRARGRRKSARRVNGLLRATACQNHNLWSCWLFCRVRKWKYEAKIRTETRSNRRTKMAKKFRQTKDAVDVGAGRKKFKLRNDQKVNHVYWVYYGRSPMQWFRLIMNITNRVWPCMITRCHQLRHNWW